MKEKSIYPVIFNDKLYYKEDCDELFVDMSLENN